MDESLRELAGTAQERAGGPIDFESLVQETIKAYGNIMRFGERYYTFDYDSIFSRYAEKLGKEKLTSLEKKQAILNAVLEQADEQD
jgi:hypothetical protein